MTGKYLLEIGREETYEPEGDLYRRAVVFTALITNPDARVPSSRDIAYATGATANEAINKALNKCHYFDVILGPGPDAISAKITSEHYVAAMGHAPQDDDLERANCHDAGQFGHLSCGWCAEHDKPFTTHFRHTVATDAAP